MSTAANSKGFLRDIDDEKMQSLRNRPWELFGFGAQYAWMLSVLFTPTVFSFAPSSGWMQATRLLLFVGLALGYLVFHLLRNKLASGRFSRGVIVTAGFCGSAATLLVCLSPLVSSSLLPSIIAAPLAGFSNAVAMLGGNRLWADHRPERAMMHLAPSSLLAAILSLLIAFLPAIARIVIVAILPPLGNVILAFSHAGKPRAGSYRHTPLDDKLTARMSIFLACFAAVTACALGALAGNEVSLFEEYAPRILLGVLGVGILAFLVALRCTVTRFLDIICKFSTPLALVGLTLFTVLPAEYSWTGIALVLAGYILMDLYMWLLNADLVYRSQKTSFAVLARSCAMQWTGWVVGFVIGSCGYVFASAQLSWSALIAACLIVLILAYTFIFGHHDAVLLAEARSDNDVDMGRDEALKLSAERHALSKRETEVFILLSAGRSAPYIQKQLTVSESTVKTHVRNIYHKFGVENRQEFLDAIENELGN